MIIRRITMDEMVEMAERRYELYTRMRWYGFGHSLCGFIMFGFSVGWIPALSLLVLIIGNNLEQRAHREIG
jgi:hypothetical protein